MTFRRLTNLVVLVAALTAVPQAAWAASSQVTGEQTVLSRKGADVFLFDQMTLAGKGQLTWPVPADAAGLTVNGARLLSRSGGSVSLMPTATSVILTYHEPVGGERFIWSRPVPVVPGSWTVLVGQGLQAGFVKNLPFVPNGDVTIAGQKLAAYTYSAQKTKASSFAWPFLASSWPGRLSAASWGAVAVVLLIGLLGARRLLRSARAWD